MRCYWAAAGCVDDITASDDESQAKFDAYLEVF
jgi:hypothetical protein